MTTCVYDKHKMQIAIDSRITAGGRVVTDKEKKWRKGADGKLYFMLGTCHGSNRIIDLVESGYDEDECYTNLEGMVVEVGDSVFEYFPDENGYIVKQDANEGDYCVNGSGKDLALAAMDMGKTAKQAVQYAATRDIYTGGKVHVYDIKKGKFING